MVIVLLETQIVQSIAQEDKLTIQILTKYNTHNQVHIISITWDSKLSCQSFNEHTKHVIQNALFTYVNINIGSLQCEYSCLLGNFLTSFWSLLLLWQILYTVAKNSIHGHHVFLYLIYAHRVFQMVPGDHLPVMYYSDEHLYSLQNNQKKRLAVFRWYNYTWKCQQCNC